MLARALRSFETLDQEDAYHDVTYGTFVLSTVHNVRSALPALPNRPAPKKKTEREGKRNNKALCRRHVSPARGSGINSQVW